jgi:hypothetical protein
MGPVLDPRPFAFRGADIHFLDFLRIIKILHQITKIEIFNFFITWDLRNSSIQMIGISLQFNGYDNQLNWALNRIFSRYFSNTSLISFSILDTNSFDLLIVSSDSSTDTKKWKLYWSVCLSSLKWSSISTHTRSRNPFLTYFSSRYLAIQA